MRIACVLVGLAIVAAGAGCSDEGKKQGPYTPPPDQPASGSMSVDEKTIVLRADGDAFFVDLTVAGKGNVKGTVLVDLVKPNWSGETAACMSLSAAVEVKEGSSKTVSLGPANLDGCFSGGAVGELGGLVLAWQVAAEDGTIFGRRSAWEAFVPFDVQLWAPSSVQDGRASLARVRVTRAGTEEPVEGVEVGLSTGAVTGKTDAAGMWTGEFSLNGSGTQTLEAWAKAGPLMLKASTEVAVSASGQRLLLTTDKPLYQPGQTIHMRVMALEVPGNVPVKGSDAEFVVVDPKGNKVARQHAATNAYGVASTEFKLGKHLNLGKYDVVVIVNGVQEAKAVKVSRYTLPKFKVEVSLKQGWFMPGDTVEGTVHAYYLFGKPVAGGTVEVGTLAADGETAGPFTATGKTSDEGYYDFSAELPEDLGKYMSGGDGLLYLTVKVTDTADQDQESMLAVALTTKPLRVYLVPETDGLAVGMEHLFYVVTTDPAGKPVQTDAEVTCGDEKLDVTTDSQGVGTFFCTPPAEGTYKIKVAATDGKNQGDTGLDFQVGATETGLVVRTDLAVYRVGETVKVTVLSGLPDALVFLDVGNEGGTVAMDGGLLDDGQIAFDLPVPAGWDGELLLTATRFADGGTTTQARHTVFVHQHRSLAVAMSTDKELYAPGDPAALSIAVKDEEGKPRQAALGLTVVDEAIYAIQDVKPGLLWEVFEAGGHLAEPTWDHKFPKVDLVALLGDALPDAADAMLHFQTYAAAAFSAVHDLGLATVTATGLAGQEGVALGMAHNLVHSQVGAITIFLRDEFGSDYYDYHYNYDGDWDAVNDYVSSHVWTDPWGMYYQVEEKEWGGLDFTSAGMDELFGTGDDVSAYIGDCDLWPCYYADSSYYSPDASVDLPGTVADTDASVADTEQPEQPLASGGMAVKVRKWFPETLYVNPALITDEQGKAKVDLTLADSITQWRATALANAASGHLGSAMHGITVFQDFFVDPDLPVSYTRNDEVTFPVAVYNYLDKEQPVTVSLQPDSWFELLSPGEQTITMPAGAVDAVKFTMRVTKAGLHTLLVTGIGPDVQDAIARTIEVEPGGRVNSVTQSGSTGSGTEGTFVVPANAIADSAKAHVKFYSKGMVHVLEGVDGLLHLPYG